MSEVDYLGELNDVLIFRERITGVGKGNKNIIAYNEIDHVKKILMLNDPGLDNGIVLVVKCWEARGFIITGHEHGHLLVWDVDSGSVFRLHLYSAGQC